MGALVPSGASISPMPASTSETNVTLRVAGPGVVAFKWKLNSGPWSPEIPLTNSFLIDTNYWNPTNGLVRLNGLANGDYTFYAVGKNSAGTWQSTNAAAARSWAVASAILEIDRITKTAATVKLYFEAAAGQTYTVQKNNSLEPNTWSKLADVSGASGQVEVTDSDATAPQRFYRLVTPAQP